MLSTTLPKPEKTLSLPKISTMRKTSFIILFTTMTLFGFSQEDLFGFNRFKADNERIAKSTDGCHPNPDTYYIMEELVLKAIGEALKYVPIAVNCILIFFIFADD